MAERTTGWEYSNDGRIAFAFLALAIILLAIGLLAVTAFGSDAANGGVALLAIAMFLLVFSVLVFVPRLARRGPASFSFYSRRSLDEAVKAVREAIEASGRTPRVDIVKSRSDQPPRIVTAEGTSSRRSRRRFGGSCSRPLRPSRFPGSSRAGAPRRWPSACRAAHRS